MARRRKLTAPTAADLAELEEGFAAKPSPVSAAAMMPPIAQVAAEAAALTPMVTPEMRAEAARDKRDAERLRQAEAEGLVMLDIPADQIVAEELTRDRMELEREAMEELKTSIRLSGLRLPVEVFELDGAPAEGPRYGLLSGFRRLAAIKALAQETGGPATIRAILRHPGSVAGAYLHMVEENEIRASLTPYERGRVAVQAVAHGAYDGVEEAVNGLFHAASKAKRSKIRSFALVHEELGDMLAFPLSLSERNGLRLAGALRAGFAGGLREALASGMGTDPDTEWALMEPLVAESEQAAKPPSRGGRPRRGAAGPADGPGMYALGNGIVLRRGSDSKGYYIRLEGRIVDADMVDTVMFEVKRLLEPR